MIEIGIFLAALESEEDKEALCAMWERKKEAAFRTAREILRNSADAEDAVSEALYYFVNRYRYFAGKKESDLDNLFLYFVRLKAIAIFRKSRKNATLQIPPILPDNSSPEEDEQAQQLAKWISELPEKHALPLILYCKEFSIEDIAAILGISVSGVYKRIERAQNELKKRKEREQCEKN